MHVYICIYMYIYIYTPCPGFTLTRGSNSRVELTMSLTPFLQAQQSESCGGVAPVLARLTLQGATFNPYPDAPPAGAAGACHPPGRRGRGRPRRHARGAPRGRRGRRPRARGDAARLRLLARLRPRGATCDRARAARSRPAACPA